MQAVKREDGGYGCDLASLGEVIINYPKEVLTLACCITFCRAFWESCKSDAVVLVNCC